MMKLLSLFVLITIFISISNGDVCVSGGGSSNTGFFGQYVEQSGTSNGMKYYKEETICGDNYLYNYNNQWIISNTLGSGSSYIRCSTIDASITSPENCPSYTGATDVTVSNDEICGEDLLTARCTSITVSGASNSDIDGSYNVNEPGYYVKLDGSRYISYRVYGSHYVGNAVGDVRCQRSISGTYLDFSRENVAALTAGTEVSFTAEFPSREVSISCSSDAAVLTPSPVAVSASGDICITTTYAGISGQAGAYNEIENIDGKAAYQLTSACGGQTYYIRYSTSYGRYMLVTDKAVPGSYVNYCQKDLPNDDITQCVFGSYSSYISASSDASCECGAN